MNLIRRASALSAAATTAALVTVTAGACRPTPSATGTPTNGLEKKSAADVLQAAAAALAAAKSVHVVVTGPGTSVPVDVRIQPGSETATLTPAGHQIQVIFIGSASYVKSDQTGLKMIGAPPPIQRHDAGRWLKVRHRNLTGFSLASLASRLTAYNGPLEPKVRQATLDGKKVVVIGWRDGAKLYVANTGPAYPLRGEFKTGPNRGLATFTDYGARFHVTAPINVIDLSHA